MEPRKGDHLIRAEELEGKVHSLLSGVPEITDEAVDRCIAAVSAEELKGRVPADERLRLEREVFERIRGFDVLGGLLADPEVTEILVNGPERIFAEKDGRLYETGLRFASEEKLMALISRIASSVNRRVNVSTPITDARLPDGSRVNIVLPPVSLRGPVMSIRKFGGKLLTLSELRENGSLTGEMEAYLDRAVKERRSLFVSGGTGTGKTTFLNALSERLPPEERIVTIEDSAELRMGHLRNLVSLEARMPNLEGKNAVTLRDLIRTALRMRPDRIIVGEVRGPEIVDMLNAMNSGHEGSWSSGHANSARDMLSRMEVMTLMGMDMPLAAVRRQIASAVDILVHLRRRRDGHREVAGIYELKGWAADDYCLETVFEEGDGRS